jgi:PKHD-type hydroxylase
MPMFLRVKNVLTQTEVGQILQLSEKLRFVDGRQSNPHNTAKHNLQVDQAQPDAVKLTQIAAGAVGRNEEIRNFSFPRRIAAPLLSRYEPGMTYGVHADAPYLPLPGGPLRSDVSGTLFLEDPASYSGGELVIHLGTERVAIKCAPGEMIIYPSTTLHEVAPVTQGRRLALFTFIESVIPDHVQRELLYLVNEVHALEGFKVSPENRTRLQYVAACLHRMWSR